MVTPTVSTDTDLKPGTIRLHVKHCDQNHQMTEPKNHRLYSQVPSRDVHPPSGFATIVLQAVDLSLEIFRTQRSPRKRPRTSQEGTQLLRSDRKTPSRNGILGRSMSEKNLNLGDSYDRDKRPVSDSARPTRTCEKKRAAVQLAPAIPLPLSDSYYIPKTAVHDETATAAPVQRDTITTLTNSTQAQLETLVDGALRFSLCGTLSKPANGLKVKANTFGQGLADIAPSMWKPGYVAVRTPSPPDPRIY